MKTILLYIIHLYQRLLSPDKGVFRQRRLPTCVFFPTCSDYAIGAIEKYGTLKGLWIAFRRILRCHPWQKNHVDPIP
jgi:putative membrane protein insertion efficiency factor